MIALRPDANGARATILVVEDNVELRFLVADVLRADGFKVVEASTPDEALAFLRTPNEVDLVFSDIVLPGSMDGIAFAQLLEREYPAIRILLTSGKVQPDEIPGNIRMIRKPYILARVISEVNAALQKEPGIDKPR